MAVNHFTKVLVEQYSVTKNLQKEIAALRNQLAEKAKGTMKGFAQTDPFSVLLHLRNRIKVSWFIFICSLNEFKCNSKHFMQEKAFLYIVTPIAVHLGFYSRILK